MRRKKIANGCFFEPAEEEEVLDPILGNKGGSIHFAVDNYRRVTAYDNIPDDYEKRIRQKVSDKNSENAQEGCSAKSASALRVSHQQAPSGFTVSVAYNKGGYQLIPKEDLNEN